MPADVGQLARPSVLDLAVVLLATVITAWFSPLADADLPLHLRLGAWMRDTGQWPSTEPLAWTRASAPFFAYSWLPQRLYVWAWSAWGASGLAAVHATLLGASVAAVWDVAKRDGWSQWGTRLLLGIHLILWGIVQPATRPQLVLAVAVPLAWSAALMLRDGTLWRGAVLALFASVLAVNSHLLFPLTLAPVVVLLGRGKQQTSIRVTLLFVAAIVVGWCGTPYLTELPNVFALNFARNALFGSGAAIQEHQPGFEWFGTAPIGLQLLTMLLFVLPLLPSTFAQPRGRLMWGTVAWAAGLMLFALAVRGLLLWWLLALPLIGAATSSVPVPTIPRIRLMVLLAWCGSLGALVFQAVQARAALAPLVVRAEGLPHPAAESLLSAEAWLRCATTSSAHATPSRGLRGTTVFNYGSVLAWEVPTVSWSIDGRTIFPDSVSRAEATHGEDAAWPLPYASADVVVLPPDHATARVIDADDRFDRVALHDATEQSALLWLRRQRSDAAAASLRADACRNAAQP